MLDNDRSRLSQAYPPLGPDHDELARVSGALGLGLANTGELGDEIVADLDIYAYGIGWWKRAYPKLDRRTRILLSDHLVGLARAIPGNLMEARIERLEFDDAAARFREWVERDHEPGKQFGIKPPLSAYDEISPMRAETHLAGMLRAWGSALDCLGGCLVGVAGLRADLVRADAGSARKALEKDAPGVRVLENLQAALVAAESQAGPDAWREWLVAMRNTVVHRGRHISSWTIEVNDAGVDGFGLKLPVSPEFTEVDRLIRTGGAIASNFEASAGEFLDKMQDAVVTYVEQSCAALTRLWRARRADPALVVQSPKQWRQSSKLIVPVPQFQGFAPNASSGPVTAMGAGSEATRRLQAAGMVPVEGRNWWPDPKVWS